MSIIRSFKVERDGVSLLPDMVDKINWVMERMVSLSLYDFRAILILLVAGLAAGKTYGVAKGANIIAVKVMGDGGAGAASDM